MEAKAWAHEVKAFTRYKTPDDTEGASNTTAGLQFKTGLYVGGNFSAASLPINTDSVTISGSGGAGYVAFSAQTSDPVVALVHLFADSAGRLAIGQSGASGHTAVLDNAVLTAKRVYTMPNKAGTFAMTDDNVSQFTNDAGYLDITDLASYVQGPASAVSGQLPMFNGTTGKLISDSGVAITGGGIISLGGYNLTAPATGTLVLTTGTQSIANGLTITTPRIVTALLDANGNTILALTPTASGVNGVTLTNAATSGSPAFTASGSDANITLTLNAKGTGYVRTNTGLFVLEGTTANEFRIAQTANVANGFIAIKYTNPKLGLFRSNLDFFLWYNTSTGDTTLGSVFSGAKINFAISGTDMWRVTNPGHFIAASNNAKDIGDAAGTGQPRTIYAATSVVAPTVLASTNLVVRDASTGFLSPATTVVALQNNNAFRSSNYTSGVQGHNIDYLGNAEFNNVRVRGELAASVFKVSEISATAGTLGVFNSAAALYADCTTPASTGSSFSFDAKNSDAGAMLFAVNDVVRFKTWTGAGISDSWATITARTNNTTYTSYTATLNSGSTSATYRAGTAVVDYGPSGAGFITLSADGTVGSSPNMTMATHAGSPWTTQTTLLRLGNLNGSYGYVTNTYGLGIGDYGGAQSYLTAEPANGLRILSGAGAVSLDVSGLTLSADTNIDGTSASALKWLHSGTNVGSITTMYSSGTIWMLSGAKMKAADTAAQALNTLYVVNDASIQGFFQIVSKGSSAALNPNKAYANLYGTDFLGLALGSALVPTHMLDVYGTGWFQDVLTLDAGVSGNLKGSTVIGARAYNSANISIPNATFTTLTFNSERWDTNGIHSTSSNTGRLTAATAGKYMIIGNIFWDANATGDRQIRILLNGTTEIARNGNMTLTNGNNPAIQVSTIYDLAVNDYVEVQAYQSSGGNLNVLASGNFSPEFMMTRIA